ncbi:MAG: hypothetical protein DRR42_14065 [Gammaproteobacteria bacterium]|nr:MAG: hypothetical protein DRR42_14065 [Gammaproteobacteria bacterium]
MSILICTGSLFSEWQKNLENLTLGNLEHHQTYSRLSALSEDICQQNSAGTDKLEWKVFTPQDKYADKATQLFSTAQNEPIFVWADTNSGLFLNFWYATAENAKFVLFYSSPEHELGSYLKAHPYDTAIVKKVIQAWITRTRAMLTFFMRNRDHSVLIDVESASKNTIGVIEKINKTFDVELNKPKNTMRDHEEPIFQKYLAASLLFRNDTVAEIFDEVRSAATVICDSDLTIEDIQKRTENLIPVFQKAVTKHDQLVIDYSNANEELNMAILQLHKTQEELEFYYLKECETAAQYKKLVESLQQTPLLKLARLARLNEQSRQSNEIHSQVKNDGQL